MPKSGIPSMRAVWDALRRTRSLALLACLVGSVGTTPAPAQVNVTTYHYDVSRTGWNSHETILKPANVNSNTFGLLFSYPVDGYVYAEPLYLSNLTINKKKTNVVFIATEHDSVYAFDADYPYLTATRPPAPLWHVSLGPSVPNGDVGTGDIVPEIGITSTPVIDTTTGTLYVVAKTKEQDASGNTIYVQRLHALDVTTGKEMLGGPVMIEGSVPGTGDGSDGANVAFNPLIQHNRPGLLEGTFKTKTGKRPAIYIAYASHGDNGPYHGWLFAYDALTLKQLGIFNTTPNAITNGYPLAAGGIWQSGGAPAWDGSSVYFMTGNGTFDLTGDSQAPGYGDAFVKMSTNGSLSVASYFAGFDQLTLDDEDGDLGSGGVMLLPKSVASKQHPNLLVGAGKEGKIYLLDTSSLGGYNTTDNVVQEVPGQFSGDGYQIGGIWGMPAYFNGSIYFGGQYDVLKAFSIANGTLSTSPTSQAPTGIGFPGPTPSVSSNGNKQGIVWAVQADAYLADGPAILHAYDATNLATELYRSDQTNNRDTPGAAVKFVTPTVANGKVFVGTQYGVAVYGEGKWAPAPTITPNGATSTTTITGITLSDTAAGAQIYYTTDGSLPTRHSKLYTGTPISVSNCTALQARAFVSGYSPSATTVAYFVIGIGPGNGTGLTGDYYNVIDLPPVKTTPTDTELDPTINFNWNGNPPGNPAFSNFPGTQWSARWTGKLTAQYAGDYTFTIVVDDGGRLYLDGKKIIDAWYDQAPTAHSSAPIPLKVGTVHTIRVEYYQNGGGSLLQLYWSLPGFTTQIIPQTQLNP
jgi:hypothetical protein